MNESTHRRPAKGGDELDAFSRTSRRALAWRARELAGIKVRHARRVRREVRQALRGGAEL